MNSDSVPSPLLPSFPRRRVSRPPSFVPHNILLTVLQKFGQFGAHAMAFAQYPEVFDTFFHLLYNRWQFLFRNNG